MHWLIKQNDNIIARGPAADLPSLVLALEDHPDLRGNVITYDPPKTLPGGDVETTLYCSDDHGRCATLTVTGTDDRITENSFVGPKAVNVFQLTVIRSALRLFGKTGIKANRAYTLTNMLAVATEATGKKYPRSRAGALKAHDDLETVIARARQEVG
jgi:hypothetical protein